MVPSPNNFGFAARVHAAGYRWRTWAELGVSRVSSVCEWDKNPPTGFRSLLVPVGPTDGPGDAVIRHPGDNTALFREFADLDHTDLGALQAFANEHGSIGCSCFVCPDDAESAERTRGDMDRLRHHPMELVRISPPSGEFLAESHGTWAESIARVRVAVDTLDALRSRDAKRLSELFHWKAISARSAAGMWHLDTHPAMAGGASPVRVVDVVYGPQIFSASADLSAVALTYLVRTVNQELDGRVSPVLEIDASGKVRERLAPATLLAAMWSQVYTAVSEGKEYKRCPACKGWFDVGGQEGATVRKVYCTDGCRIRACRGRRAVAVQLASEGLKPAAIVGRMKEEGQMVSAKQVAKWAKGR